MKIKKEIISEVTIGYKCDICDQPMSDNCYQFSDLSGNSESGRYRSCDMCEECFGWVEKYIIHYLGGKMSEL